MSEVLELSLYGIRLYAGQLFHHDYLWFSSFEIAKTTRTAPIIHNYALSYAVSGFTYAIYRGSRPSYDADLAKMGVYTTPARPGTTHQPQWTRLTQNAIDSRTYRTEGPRGVNSPDLGWKIVLNPCWNNGMPEDGFRFYAFVKKGITLPSVLRLGKKGCPVRLLWRKISATKATHIEGQLQPTHAVNPLDVQGKIASYEPVSIPPHLVFRAAEIANDWFVIEGKDVIHVPRRFTPAGAVAITPPETAPPRTRRRRSE